MSDESYAEAIAMLEKVIEIIDKPDRALGYAYGLRRGQAGWIIVARARDQLRYVRDSMVRYENERVS